MMLPRLINLLGWLPVLAMLTDGCMATGIQNSKAQKLEKKYVSILDASNAFADSEENLHICFQLRLSGSATAKNYSLIIFRKDMERRSFTTLLHAGAGNYYFNTSSLTQACEQSNRSSIEIDKVFIDSKIEKANQIQDFIHSLPMKKDPYALYLLDSRRFDKIESTCRGFFKEKKCQIDLSHTWPRLIIIVQTAHRSYPLSIISGHTGRKRGHRVVPMATAATIDVITFPIQLIGAIIVRMFGSK